EARIIAELSTVPVALLLPVVIPPLLRNLHADVLAVEKRQLIRSRNELREANASLQEEVLERRRAEALSQASLLRLQGTLNNLPLGAIAVDERDMVIHM